MRFASSKLLKNETVQARKPGASPHCRGLAHGFRKCGGGERDRTDDLLLAKQALSQLSYTPVSHAAGSWWVWLESNQRPPPYQDGALTG